MPRSSAPKTRSTCVHAKTQAISLVLRRNGASVTERMNLSVGWHHDGKLPLCQKKFLRGKILTWRASRERPSRTAISMSLPRTSRAHWNGFRVVRSFCRWPSTWVPVPRLPVPRHQADLRQSRPSTGSVEVKDGRHSQAGVGGSIKRTMMTMEWAVTAEALAESIDLQRSKLQPRRADVPDHRWASWPCRCWAGWHGFSCLESSGKRLSRRPLPEA